MDYTRTRTVCFAFLLLMVTTRSFSQERYTDRMGVVVFEASEELFEEVKAKNESVSVVFDPSDNRIASLALMQGFVFKNPLMQEHFNENYMESDLYPKAIFKGSLVDFDLSKIGQEAQEFTINGTLEVHGVTQKVHPTVKIQKIGNIISIIGGFIVLPKDFDIKIPKIVENKIAKEVHVRFDFKLSAS